MTTRILGLGPSRAQAYATAISMAINNVLQRSGGAISLPIRLAIERNEVFYGCTSSSDTSCTVPIDLDYDVWPGYNRDTIQSTIPNITVGRFVPSFRVVASFGQNQSPLYGFKVTASRLRVYVNDQVEDLTSVYSYGVIFDNPVIGYMPAGGYARFTVSSATFMTVGFTLYFGDGSSDTFYYLVYYDPAALSAVEYSTATSETELHAEFVIYQQLTSTPDCSYTIPTTLDVDNFVPQNPYFAHFSTEQGHQIQLTEFGVDGAFPSMYFRISYHYPGIITGYISIPIMVRLKLKAPNGNVATLFAMFLDSSSFTKCEQNMRNPIFPSVFEIRVGLGSNKFCVADARPGEDVKRFEPCQYRVSAPPY